MARDDNEVFTRHRNSDLLRVDIPSRRQKGGVHPDWQKVAAKGPVPKAAKVKTCLKGMGSARPRENNVRGGGIAVAGVKKGPRGKKSGEGAPLATRGKRGVLCDEWLYADMEEPTSGIRVNMPVPVDVSLRRARAVAARRARQPVYVLSTPYAKRDEVEDFSYRRSRRAVTPSPTPSRGSIMGLAGISPSPTRQRGKNLTCKPTDTGIFDKTPQSERRSKYIDPHRNTNTSSAMLLDRPERIFLPTNYREKGTMSSSREGAEGCLARGAGKSRPVESLMAAWAVSSDAPSTGSTGRKRPVAESKGVPWGTQRKLSTSRFHRKKSIEASVKFLRKKVALTSRAHTPVPGQRLNEFCRTSTAGSLASFCGSENASLVSPRGKRILPQQGSSVLLNWQ